MDLAFGPDENPFAYTYFLLRGNIVLERLDNDYIPWPGCCRVLIADDGPTIFTNSFKR